MERMGKEDNIMKRTRCDSVTSRNWMALEISPAGSRELSFHAANWARTDHPPPPPHNRCRVCSAVMPNSRPSTSSGASEISQEPCTIKFDDTLWLMLPVAEAHVAQKGACGGLAALAMWRPGAIGSPSNAMRAADNSPKYTNCSTQSARWSARVLRRLDRT